MRARDADGEVLCTATEPVTIEADALPELYVDMVCYATCPTITFPGSETSPKTICAPVGGVIPTEEDQRGQITIAEKVQSRPHSNAPQHGVAHRAFEIAWDVCGGPRPPLAARPHDRRHGIDAVALVQLATSHVVPVLERIEEFVEQRVLDWQPENVILEITLRDVGLVEPSAHEHAVPRRVFGRPALRHLIVPLVAKRKHLVDIDDYPPVVEEFVMHELPHAVLGFDDDHWLARSLRHRPRGVQADGDGVRNFSRFPDFQEPSPLFLRG